MSLILLFRVSKEFATRETEREALMNRRVAEYEKMEKQLRKALLEAKNGERRVLEQGRELGRLRDEMQTEKDRIRQDAKTSFEQQKRELNGMLKVTFVHFTSANKKRFITRLREQRQTPPKKKRDNSRQKSKKQTTNTKVYSTT